MLRLLLALAASAPSDAATLRVMSYNVHSCKGRDGEVRADRIAEIVARHDPDVVALQEVRVGRVEPEEKPVPSGAATEPPAVGEPPLPPPEVIPPRRARGTAPAEAPHVDQPRVIADAAGLHSVFYPLVRTKQYDYGIAVLSRHPMRVVRAANLPTLPGRRPPERRGAIWVELDVDGRKVQLFNTHLGLRGNERRAQIDALLGPDWLSAPAASAPFVVCGDLNSSPLGRPYRKLAERAVDASERAGRTFPSLLPLVRLDYIFVSSGTASVSAETPRDALTRKSSDHLPVIAEIALP